MYRVSGSMKLIIGPTTVSKHGLRPIIRAHSLKFLEALVSARSEKGRYEIEGIDVRCVVHVHI